MKKINKMYHAAITISDESPEKEKLRIKEIPKQRVLEVIAKDDNDAMKQITEKAQELCRGYKEYPNNYCVKVIIDGIISQERIIDQKDFISVFPYDSEKKKIIYHLSTNEQSPLEKVLQKINKKN